MSPTRIYETIFVLHPELTEEEAEAITQTVVSLLTGKGCEIIRTERGGKRRLAYVIEKQRYGYYTLIHFRASADVLTELERMYRLNERVIRYLTVHVEKEEQLTSLTRMGDDDGRDDDRDDRRRGGGRRGESFRPRAMAERSRVPMEEDTDTDDLDSIESSIAVTEIDDNT